MKPSLRRALSYAAFQARALGMLGIVGLALGLGAAAYALVDMPRHAAENAALTRELASVRASRRTLEAAIATRGGAAETAPSTIAIPSAAETPALLFKLEGIARKSGLQIKRNDYRYVESAPPLTTKGKSREIARSRFVEVRISAPTAGSYGNVRGFIDEALRDIPALALDDVSLKRDAIGKGEVQAILRFSLFARNAT